MRQLKCRYIDLFQQPPSSQERGSGLAVGRQGGPGSAGGPGAVDQARDLSPCLPASMGDAARPTTLPCSPPAAHHHGSHHTPLHQTHCGTNNNCYDGSTTPYDSRDYDSPGGTVLLPVGKGWKMLGFPKNSLENRQKKIVHNLSNLLIYLKTFRTLLYFDSPCPGENVE